MSSKNLKKVWQLAFTIIVCCGSCVVYGEELQNMTWLQVKDLISQTDVAIIPLGAVEQCGPHNPIGSDYFIAEWAANQVGKRTNVLVCPVIPVGVSAKHQAFPGTLWVSPKIFKDYVKAVVLSLSVHGIRKILFLNGHGGNNNALFELTGELRRDHKIFAAFISGLPDLENEADMNHGGRVQTSINLYLYEHLVKMDMAVNTPQKKSLGSLVLKGENRIGPEGGPYAKFDSDTIDLTDNGIMGMAGLTIDVTGATAKEGKSLMEGRVDEICKLVEGLKKANYKDLMSKSLIN